MGIIRIQFQIHGKVQKVFFRKYTKLEADRLGLVGWVRNTLTGSVEGVAEGRSDRVGEFAEWLRTEGSPGSRVDQSEILREEIHQVEFEEFSIRK
jgi:acylphosphatase